ncbi:MAG: LEA type 2 family protein [Phycisphaeraceae bacterium]|nr:LEA type 2 family protein [Phycisphaerales bacterium]MCB9859775.1 LEA type 2 family protein [Phycisphaeraceae bacterium]
MQIFRHTRIPMLALCLLCVCVGCSAPVSPPSIHVEPGATIIEQSDHGMVVQVNITAANPNTEPLPLRDIEYHVDMNGQRVFAGKRSAETTLRRNDEHTISLPVVIKADQLTTLQAASSTVSFNVSGTMVYLVRGPIAEVLFDAGIRRPTKAFSGGGEITLP